jgi:TPR repeat protein
MFRLACIAIIFLTLSACATHHTSYAETAQVVQGKREFEKGFYREAMKRLLPIACDGNAQAQYAVGYMFYYGYGVAQDTDMGCFWIKRSADQGYPPAIKALQTADINTIIAKPPTLTLSPQLQAQASSQT